MNRTLLSTAAAALAISMLSTAPASAFFVYNNETTTPTWVRPGTQDNVSNSGRGFTGAGTYRNMPYQEGHQAEPPIAGSRSVTSTGSLRHRNPANAPMTRPGSYHDMPYQEGHQAEPPITPSR